MLKSFFKYLAAGLAVFTASTAIAYDNSRSPSFEAARVGRGFENISIHPNGDEWLVSEFSNAFTPHKAGYLLIYNLRDHSYQRLDLPMNYSYLGASFSSTGEKILFIRQPPSRKGGHDDVMNSYARGEIVIMNRDGSDYRVLPMPPNRVVCPTLSPSGTKLAYLVASSDKPPARWTFMAYYDIWEFDLNSGENQLFAGPLTFYHATMISYLSESEIIASAMFPYHTGTDEHYGSFSQYQGSEIFRIKRGIRFAPEPIYYDLPFAKFPSVDQQGNIFHETAPSNIGLSLPRNDIHGNTTIWRAPRMNMAAVSQYTVDPGGAYVAFIYGGPPIKSKEGSSALGYFDLKTEKWISVAPPPVSESTLIPLKINQ